MGCAGGSGCGAVDRRVALRMRPCRRLRRIPPHSMRSDKAAYISLERHFHSHRICCTRRPCGARKVEHVYAGLKVVEVDSVQLGIVSGICVSEYENGKVQQKEATAFATLTLDTQQCRKRSLSP